jgi:hypothetical protein
VPSRERLLFDVLGRVRDIDVQNPAVNPTRIENGSAR